MLDAKAMDLIFREAHTHNAWSDKPVPDAVLRRAYDLMKFAPTSANCSPARIVFVRSKAAKAKLGPALSEGNLAKTMAAPATAIVGYDTEFYEKLPRLYPQADARSWFAGKPALIEATAFRNSSMQGGYFILAARAVGLDCGPMSGFDNAKVDAAFFPGGKVKSNFLCNLGYGDPRGVRPRNLRFEFDEVCSVV
ncbi:MAG: malonic semialdehyde reductase [Rhodospirillales bacterium]